MKFIYGSATKMNFIGNMHSLGGYPFHEFFSFLPLFLLKIFIPSDCNEVSFSYVMEIDNLCNFIW